MRIHKALKLHLHHSFTMLAKEIVAQSARSVRRPGIGRRRVPRRERRRGGREVAEGRRLAHESPISSPLLRREPGLRQPSGNPRLVPPFSIRLSRDLG
jgi:hypothetical protein